MALPEPLLSLAIGVRRTDWRLDVAWGPLKQRPSAHGASSPTNGGEHQDGGAAARP